MGSPEVPDNLRLKEMEMKNAIEYLYKRRGRNITYTRTGHITPHFIRFSRKGSLF